MRGCPALKPPSTACLTQCCAVALVTAGLLALAFIGVASLESVRLVEGRKAKGLDSWIN
jgi:hypothetical protein